MLTTSKVSRVVCRTSAPLCTPPRVATYATGSSGSGDWLQRDQLKQKLKTMLDQHNTRQQRLDHAEKILPYYILFPNEADPTKPSKEAVAAAVAAAHPAKPSGAVPIPNWREAVAKHDKEWAEKKRKVQEENEARSKELKATAAHH